MHKFSLFLLLTSSMALAVPPSGLDNINAANNERKEQVKKPESKLYRVAKYSLYGACIAGGAVSLTVLTVAAAPMTLAGALGYSVVVPAIPSVAGVASGTVATVFAAGSGITVGAGALAGAALGAAEEPKE